MTGTLPRRDFLKMAASSLAAASLAVRSRQVSAAQRPNIILVMADDLGFGDVAYNGNTTVHTPHPHAVAAECVRCERS